MRFKSEKDKHTCFLGLFTANEASIHGYVRRLVYKREDAMDVMQKIAIVLWKKFDQLQSDNDFRKWAFGVARFEVLAWRRGSKSETWITITSVFSYTVFYPWFALMMLWFFGYKLGWFPIGKFLYPEKWYDAPFDSDVIFAMMIKFVLVVSLIQFAAYTVTRGIESLSSRRNIRF